MANAARKQGQESAEQAIRSLARVHNITPSRDDLDLWADDVTRLAGDEVLLDEVEELVVALRRAGTVDGIELTRLHSRYLDERAQPS